jgi:hypothetical protein
MPSPTDWTPEPEDRDLALSLLNEMQRVRCKRDDQELRHQLKSLVVTCIGAGKSLELSDQSNELGKLMARANARAKQMGWL